MKTDTRWDDYIFVPSPERAWTRVEHRNCVHAEHDGPNYGVMFLDENTTVTELLDGLARHARIHGETSAAADIPTTALKARP